MSTLLKRKCVCLEVALCVVQPSTPLTVLILSCAFTECTLLCVVFNESVVTWRMKTCT